MPEPGSDFPERVVLNGIDVFLLHLDAIMAKSVSYRNVCTLVLEIDSPISASELNTFLLQQQGYRWIKQLRLNSPGLFTLPSWIRDPKANIPDIEVRTLDQGMELPSAWLTDTIESEVEAPFKLVLVHTHEDKCFLIFFWHHALMDAHGGELLVKAIAGNNANETLSWVNEAVIEFPLLERAKIAQEMKKFIYEVSSLPLFALFNKKYQKRIQLDYKTVIFSKQQYVEIQKQAQTAGAGAMHSAFYLAVIACALTQVRELEESDGDILVPVPQDRRLRGAKGPILGNQVTFLFYRIPQKVLIAQDVCTAEIIRQMLALIRSNRPQDYLTMMAFLRRVPGPLYRFLLKQPTSGLMGSFFYSDTGDSLDELKYFFNKKISLAIHYPPNIYPPGLTFVFSRTQQNLQLTIGYMRHLLKPEELEYLIGRISAGLTGEHSAATL